MNESRRNTLPTNGRIGSTRFLALLGILLFVGISLYASREPVAAVIRNPNDDYGAGLLKR